MILPALIVWFVEFAEGVVTEFAFDLFRTENWCLVSPDKVSFSLNESSLSKIDESSYDESTYDDSLNADGDWLPISDILVDSRDFSGTVDSVLACLSSHSKQSNIE